MVGTGTLVVDNISGGENGIGVAEVGICEAMGNFWFTGLPHPLVSNAIKMNINEESTLNNVFIRNYLPKLTSGILWLH